MMINLDEVRGFYGEYFGEAMTRERIADMGWQISAGRVGVQSARRLRIRAMT